MVHLQVEKQFAHNLPDDRSLKRHIARLRQRELHDGLPPCPKTLAELSAIPAQLVEIEWDGERESVLKGDNGRGVCAQYSRTHIV